MRRPLPEPRTPEGAAGLAELLAEPARAVVAVDFDGTLAPIVRDPDQARPVAGATDVLGALAGRVGTCALVTGRPAADAAALVGLDGSSRVVVLGHYGLQRWSDGTLESPAPDPAIEVARTRLPALLATASGGVRVEDKEHSIAVHTRPAADPAAAMESLRARLEALADELGLEAVPGRFVIELRPTGVDKGSALRRLVTERDARTVLYVGDDLGDLPAFAVVEEHRNRGGAGLTVASVDPGADDAPTELAERADLVVAGPAAVVDLLVAVAEAVGEP